MPLHPDTTALLVIDLQPDFMPGGALPCHEGDAVVPGIADLLASGAGLEEGSPILALRRRLESTDGWMKDRPAVTAAWFIKAWNAWRAGREMQVLRWKVGGANPEPFPAIEGLTQALRGMEKSA